MKKKHSIRTTKKINKPPQLVTVLQHHCLACTISVHSSAHFYSLSQKLIPRGVASMTPYSI